MKIGLIVAMDKEFAQLASLLSHPTTEQRSAFSFTLGQMGQADVVLMKCGIGKVNSAMGAQQLIECYHPDLVVSTGCAGGADPSLHVMDVVVSTECAYHDAYCGSECEKGQILGLPARFCSPAELVGKALTLNDRQADQHIVAGLIVSGEWFVDSQDKMRSILADFPTATAVDMESCSIAHACHLLSVPFISFRVISDVPLADHKASQYFDFWDRLAGESFQVTRHFLERIIEM